jgi:hypothetical protein
MLIIENKPDLSLIAKKRQYKLRGVFLSFESITHYLGKVYISKGTGAKKKIFVFTVSGKLVADFMALKPKYRIKVWFNIKCREYKSKWFTEMIIESFEHWIVNEKKVLAEAKQLKLEDEKRYEKSLYTDNDYGYSDLD